MDERVLITGITGMDGSILARKLLGMGWEVWGLMRRSSGDNLWRIQDIKNLINFIDGDLIDYPSLVNAVLLSRPDWVINCAAQSHVGVSFSESDYTMRVTGLGAINMMEAVRHHGKKSVRFLQLSSSEMFGQPIEVPQNEDTPLKPISPYAVAKTAAHNYAEMLRKMGMWISCAISNNHECEVRGGDFLTTKVAKAAARRETVTLGNLTAQRDWSYSPEICDALIKILEHNIPDTFVLGTGVTHYVETYVRLAYNYMGLNWKDYVCANSNDFVRPVDAGPLQADPAKAYRFLNWKTETSFEDLVKILVDHFRVDD